MSVELSQPPSVMVPAHVLVADESEIRDLEACWERIASTRAQLATAEESFDVGRIARTFEFSACVRR